MEEGRKRKYSHIDNAQCSCQGSSSCSVDENSLLPDHSETCPAKRIKGNDAQESSNLSDPAAGTSSSSSDGKSHSSSRTPAPVFNKSLLAPGAPRVLVENQQVNAEPASELLNLDAFNYSQYLRTPPSIKNQKLYFKGNSPQLQHMGFDRFDRVSDEIILKILHYLPRHTMCTCALVCRRWARIVCDMSLWRRMDLGGRLVKKGVLKIILERGVEVLRLNRSEINGDFDSTVVGSPDPRRSPLSEDRLYRLKYLDMSMANVRTPLVESMLKFCPNLCKLSLENIPVTDQLLINLSLNSPYLDTLNLCMSTGLTAKGLCHVFQNCASLSELNIAWTWLCPSDIMAVARSLPSQLLALNISGCRERITDNAVAALSERCPYLQDLDLSDSTQISYRAINAVVSNLPQLRMISLSRCYRVDPSHIVNLKDLPHLERLNVFGIMSDATFDIIEQHLSSLKINRYPFSAIARPTVNNSKYVRIWNQLPKN